jgi:hypothetical protein
MAPDIFMRCLAASLTCALCTATAWGQATPNWGALGTAPAPAQAASSLQSARPGTAMVAGSALGSKTHSASSALGALSATPTITTNAQAALPPIGAKAALLPSTKPALEKTALLPPADVVAHLKSAGLDAKDPALGAKLKALAQQHGTAYVRNHVVSSSPVVSKQPSRAFIRAQGPTQVRMAAPEARLASVNGQFVGLAEFLGSVHTLKDAPPQPGQWIAAIISANLLLPANSVSPATFSVSFDCGGLNPRWSGRAFSTSYSAIQEWPQVYQPQLIGPPYKYVATSDSGPELPIGRIRTGNMTIQFDAVSVSASPRFAPGQASVTIDATVDHTPVLTGIGSVSPWGSTGLGATNATLQNAGTPRVGTGDWSVNTQGTDTVGDVQLGPGWTVTSTVIKSAVSATTPQNLVPDNTWRGAKVTQTPPPGTLRTGVAWHYSGVDSLDYTIEWTLSGPLGQRPLMTMVKHDSCDS